MPNKCLSMFIYVCSTLSWGLQSGGGEGKREGGMEGGREKRREEERKEVVLFLYRSRYAGPILEMDKMGAFDSNNLGHEDSWPSFEFVLQGHKNEKSVPRTNPEGPIVITC